MQTTIGWEAKNGSQNANGIEIPTDTHKHYTINHQCNHCSNENVNNASGKLINLQKCDDFSLMNLINPKCSHNTREKTLLTDNENLINTHNDNNAHNDNWINKADIEIFLIENSLREPLLSIANKLLGTQSWNLDQLTPPEK